MAAAGPAPEAVGAPQPALAPQQKAVFDGVRNGLAVKSEVGWDAAEESTRLACETLAYPETLDFLAVCLESIVKIFLMQKNPSLDQKRNVDMTLGHTTNIILALVKRGDVTHLGVLAQLFDKQSFYYKGNSNDKYSNAYSSGSPMTRYELLKIFMRGGGFVCLLKIFTGLAERGVDAWVGKDGALGGKNLRLLMHGLVDALKIKSDSLGNREFEVDDTYRALADLYAAQLEAIAEAVVKVEGADTLQEMWQTCSMLLRLTKNSRVHDEAWTRLTLRFVRSASLPLRLVGWDQVERIVQHAQSHTPRYAALLAPARQHDGTA